jgi:hypothetical protein
MQTRIRYNKESNGNLVLRSPLVAGGDLLTVTLMPDQLGYVITDATSGSVVENGTATSLQMLKIRVKRSLISRGVVFSEEVRSRDTSE